MKKLTSLLALAAALGVGLTAKAQILVGASGTATLTFDSSPTLNATEWATSGGIGGTSSATYNTPDDVEVGVQTVNQNTVTTVLPRITANGTSANARHNTAGGYIVQQCTGAAANLLKATLRNNSPQALSHLTVQYDFGQALASFAEEING